MTTELARQGMVVAPHAQAAECGLDVLREGGNAIEATIAVAASLSVLYPHMTGLGGDSFWLISCPGDTVYALTGSGRTAQELDINRYRQAGFQTMPVRGPWAANTVAGTVSAWDVALTHSQRKWAGRLPLSTILQGAIRYATNGCVISESQASATSRKYRELIGQPGFSETYLRHGEPPTAGTLQIQPALGRTLEWLADNGLKDFYHGELAQAVISDLVAVGSPLTAIDLDAQVAELVAPISLQLPGIGRYFTTAPPTQGLATLYILGQFAHHPVGIQTDMGVDYVHYLVESTKQAFRLRDMLIRDPQDMPQINYTELLVTDELVEMSARIKMDEAMSWTGTGDMCDTTWFGVIDREGRAVSCIQSLYHEFGSGVVLPQSGICWQNRGSSFSLDPLHPRALKPGRLPFHTLCPSLVEFDDGRLMVLGTMGGDGQPQTQSCVFTRYAYFKRSLQEAISAPRWVLGRTWGQDSNSLKLESRFANDVFDSLRARGHKLERVAAYDEMMGHAGALVRWPDGRIDGAADPRSDGAAVGF